MITNATHQHIEESKKVKKILAQVVALLVLGIVCVFFAIKGYNYQKSIEQSSSYEDKNSFAVYSLLSKNVVQLKNLFTNDQKTKDQFIDQLKDSYPSIKIKDNTLYSNSHGFKINIINNGISFKGSKVLCMRIQREIANTDIKLYKEDTLININGCENFKENTNMKVIF